LKEFIRNNRFTLIGFTCGLIIAFIFYLSNSKSNRYRVIFQYPTAESSLLPPTLKTDTFFIYNSIPIRTYENSYSDTLGLQGIKRSELIVYYPDKVEKGQLKKIVSPILSYTSKLIEVKYEGQKAYNKRFLIIPFIGLFLGYLMNLLKFKNTATKKHKTTPI